MVDINRTALMPSHVSAIFRAEAVKVAMGALQRSRAVVEHL